MDDFVVGAKVQWTDLASNQQYGIVQVVMEDTYGIANIDRSYWGDVPKSSVTAWDGQ